jgi:exodeoxyribonuclease VII large subunit
MPYALGMNILTVSQVAARLREMMEADYLLADIWVSGEVSESHTQQRSGHTYFVLKDEGAQLRGVFFRPAGFRQRQMLEHLERGAQVVVHGRITVYEARGDLQIIADFVHPQGVGLRHAELERLRQRLEEEGLFEPSRKRPLPMFPKRVGVVTSPAGAVFHDICNVIERRWPLAEVVLAETPVQGPEAAAGIVSAIRALNDRGDIDVIVVARGGGSVEEMWAFNEESVARAVFGSLVPIVSGVGHETDVTICDHAADVRAPTPSAAAELVVPDRRQVSHRLSVATGTALFALRSVISRDRTAVESSLRRAERGLPDIGRWRQRLDELDWRGLQATTRTFEQASERLKACQRHLAALDPQATLNRGYAVVHKDGRVVSRIADVVTNDALVIKVADGGFPARVEAPGTRRRRAAGAGAQDGNKAAERGLQQTLFP